ncbi:MAG: DUF302 domain-containing protein [Adhaeribacter sp.]
MTKIKVHFMEGNIYYLVLGACNPKLAYQAIQQKANTGVIMPCNIMVQEHRAGRVEVIAQEVSDTLRRVLTALWGLRESNFLNV